MSASIHDVVVLGGGISGLTAAWHLERAGLDVRLLEASDTVGGCTRTVRRDGYLLEQGPFNVMIRHPSFQTLLETLEDRITVVPASDVAKHRYIYRRGRLIAVPTNPIALLTTPLLAVGSRLRLLRGLLLSRRHPRAGEQTIEQVTIRRFGPEVSVALVSAAISGIFAGDIRKLSLAACFPAVADIDRSARSLIGYGFRSALFGKKKFRRRWRGLVSFEGGLGTLTETLGQSLGEGLQTRCRAESISSADGGYEVTYEAADGQTRTARCANLLVALPGGQAGRVLEPLTPGVESIVNSIPSASLVVLNIGFRRAQIDHPLDGFGFLVPHDETDFPLMGVLWADSVFPHHAPADHRLLRVFIGGTRDPHAAERSDTELQELTMGALRDVLRIEGQPTLVDICRYGGAIPQYHVGHRAKVERFRTLTDRPGLCVIGNYLDGVSLNDCVRTGTQAAERIIQSDRRAANVAEPMTC